MLHKLALNCLEQLLSHRQSQLAEGSGTGTVPTSCCSALTAIAFHTQKMTIIYQKNPPKQNKKNPTLPLSLNCHLQEKIPVFQPPWKINTVLSLFYYLKKKKILR